MHSPRLRVERQVQIQLYNPSTDNIHHNTQQNAHHSESGKILHHMAQSSRSQIGVNLFWETGANPPTEWQTWIARFKMAVRAQHNPGKLLHHNSNNTNIIIDNSNDDVKNIWYTYPLKPRSVEHSPRKTQIKNWQMHNKWVSTRTDSHLHTAPKHHVWQVPTVRGTTTTKWKPRDLL